MFGLFVSNDAEPEETAAPRLDGNELYVELGNVEPGDAVEVLVSQVGGSIG